MGDIIIRAALLADLPRLTEIHNYYVVNTHITFDVQPYAAEQRVGWFQDHCDGHRYRLLVAADSRSGVVGYVATGRFRNKEAYDTTVEISVACSPDATGRSIGTELYKTLFEVIANEDIHRIVAGIAQPNQSSNALHQLSDSS